MPGAVVVGTGFGCRVHVPALRAAGFTVHGLVGRDEDRTRRRAERLGIPQAFTSLSGALTLAEVDAVTIATPPATHASLVVETCEAGRHVVCEKPFALDTAEADRMLAAAEQARVTHLVGHEFRWSPDRALVGRAIAEGALGVPRLFSLVSFVPMVADPDAQVPPWWFDGPSGGGWLGASGSHIVDQLRTWFGEFASVSATLPTVSAREAGAEDTFVIRATMRNGVEGVIQQTAASWTPEPVGVSIVAGTAATIEIGVDGVFCSDRRGRRVLDIPADLALGVSPARSDDPRERYTHLELAPYTRLAEALRAGVEGNPADSAVSLPTFVDGVAEMRVIDAIRASAAAGGTVVSISG